MPGVDWRRLASGLMPDDTCFACAPHHAPLQVEHEAPTENVRCLFVDCGPLKHALVQHCEAWRSKLAGLLATTAAAELRALGEYFRCGQQQRSAAAMLCYWCKS